MNSKKKHCKPGRPIRGSLKPLYKSNVDKVYDGIIHTRGIVNIQDLDFWRDACKDTVATYFAYADRTTHRRKLVNDNSKYIIEQEFAGGNNQHILGFISCCISFYNDEIEHVAHLNMDIPECNSKDKVKSISHARENSKKFVKCRINRIIKNMEEGFWTNIPNDVMQQYLAIPVSINFICKYFSEIRNGKFPKLMDLNTYNTAYELDNRLERYYVYDDTLQKYSLTKDKARYSSVNQECATVIICRNLL